MSSGTMVALADSVGDIDTSDQLTMFEGYQKCFVVNGSNLKVADCMNYMLVHTALATAHSKGDILTQATSAATMIVDFTNTAKTATYGYVTSGTFDTANQVTGSGSGTAFTPTSVTDHDPPLWYDWTVYPGGTFGSMPDKAYLGCLYRGRAVLSGNPNYPYQWYMSRVNNPWDWAYAANDAMSPVAGSNADAGEMGDIIRALIPYKDEYLIFGCYSSIWALRGDPASGGSLEEVDLTLGMFGANSWCFDGQDNLYFFSMNGLYKLIANLGGIVPVSVQLLPKLSTDLALDPSTHRITLVYDVDRYGICIFITTLATGANTNYFYDLRTEGLYPETYPTSCGVYSALYYSNGDPDYRGIITGSTDGYIRYFNEAEKNDVGTTADSIIISSVVLPVAQNDDDDREIRLNSLTVSTAGGSTGGTYSDTDAVTVNLYSGESAEEVLEAIEDGDTPHTAVSITGSGRQSRIRNRVRGHTLAVELKNSTSDSSWAVERVSADIESVGKVR